MRGCENQRETKRDGQRAGPLLVIYINHVSIFFYKTISRFYKTQVTSILHNVKLVNFYGFIQLIYKTKHFYLTNLNNYSLMINYPYNLFTYQVQEFRKPISKFPSVNYLFV